jgi:hypothetical protein
MGKAVMCYLQAMNRPTAIIDKSMLQAICEQTADALDECFNTLLGRYVLVVPSILVEEVWVNLANPSPTKRPEVAENMVACLLHLQDAWIAEPLDIAFAELVKRESIEILPRPPSNVMNSFFILRRDNEALRKWVKERKELHEKIIRRRVQDHAQILNPNEAAQVASEQEFFEKFIRPKFVEMLSDPARKHKLLEGVFGLAFRARYPDCSKQIDAAFESYSLETFDKYHATFNCIMSAMFYFYAPLCKIRGTDKIVGRGFKHQKSNLNDEKYVQSALLCARLATRDEDMRNIMELFRACGLWNGKIIFTNPGPSQNLLSELAAALK